MGRRGKPKNKDWPRGEAKIGMWTAVRDTAIASLNRGQFPIAVIAAILIIMLVKMPSEDVSTLAFKMYDDLVRFYLVGYVATIALALGWTAHARAQRRTIHLEMRRISDEKTKLQKRLLNRDLSSSETKTP